MSLTKDDLELRTLSGIFYQDPMALKPARDEDEHEERIDHEFSMFVFEFDPNVGLFLARCEDEFGKSGITGRILNNGVRVNEEFPFLHSEGYNLGFVKSYPNTHPNRPIDPDCIEHLPEIFFRRYFYAGDIEKSNGALTLNNGRYASYGFNWRKGGYWEVKSIV